MKGAIIGDIIGSAFIKNNRSTTNFQLFKPISSFTDDTIMTLATADAIFHNKDLKETLRTWVTKYPYAKYNPAFKKWLLSDTDAAYNSSGDGSARRVSPIGLAANSLEEVFTMTEKATIITHNEPSKINASKAMNAAIFMAKAGSNKTAIKSYITKEFGYNLNKTVEELQEEMISPSTETPVPAAITVFLQSSNYEDAIRKAVSLGGPSNTIGSITGAIAYAYYKHIPKSIIRRALIRLTPEMVRFINEFEEAHLPLVKTNNQVLFNIH